MIKLFKRKKKIKFVNTTSWSNSTARIGVEDTVYRVEEAFAKGTETGVYVSDWGLDIFNIAIDILESRHPEYSFYVDFSICGISWFKKED